MARKKRSEKTQREPTKRQLSHWQQQQKRQRIILGAGIVVIAAVILILGAGWYFNSYRPLHVTVIKVNDTTFNMDYYIHALKVNGSGQQAQYLAQIADATTKNIERNELIRQGALQLGISVSDDNVTKQIKASKLPNDVVHRDLIRTQLLADKLKTDYFAKQVPESAEQAHIMAMLLESESEAADVRARLDKGESFVELAGALSLDSFTKQNKGELGWHPQSVFTDLLGTAVPGDYAFGSTAGVLSQPRQDTEVTKKVGYWLIKILEKNEETKQVHVNAILLSSEEEATKIRARLEKGEDFAALAKEFSQINNAKDNGGDMGFMSQGQIDAAFDSFVFNLGQKEGVEALSPVIRDDNVATKGGYWLIKVVDKAADRPLDASDRDSLETKDLNDWASSLLVDPNNKVDDSFLTDATKTFAVNTATKP